MLAIFINSSGPYIKGLLLRGLKLSLTDKGDQDVINNIIDRASFGPSGSGPVYIEHNVQYIGPGVGNWRDGRTGRYIERPSYPDGLIYSDFIEYYDRVEYYSTPYWWNDGLTIGVRLTQGSVDDFYSAALIIQPNDHYPGNSANGHIQGFVQHVVTRNNKVYSSAVQWTWYGTDFYRVDEDCVDAYMETSKLKLDAAPESLCFFYLFDGEVTSQVQGPERGEYVFWQSHSYDFPYITMQRDMIRQANFNKAFYNALEELPRLESNTFANIVEAVKLLLDLKEGWNGKWIEHADKLANDLWLNYRYVYNTSKADCEEIINTATRLLDLTEATEINTYGYVRDGDIQYHCQIAIDTKYFLSPDLKSKIRNAGIKLTAANVWDVIPFSFIVDWFADISSLCTAFDQWMEISSMPINHVWYSFSSYYDDPRISAYGRWEGSPPKLPYFETDTSASGKTITMRIADVFAIFL